jgi:DNA polymerase-3 subunit epsilon
MNYYLYRLKCWQTRRSVRNRELPEALCRHLEAGRRLSLSLPADRATFVVFDTEMTGLGPEDRLLSVGAVTVREARAHLGESFYEIMDPAHTITRESILVHQIVPCETDGRPGSSHVLPGFLDFIGPHILVGHNARFDRDFINREMLHNYGTPLMNPILDVLLLSRTNSHLRTKYHVSGALEDHSLDGLAAAYGVAAENRHTAFGDALTTALIFLRLMKALQRFGLYKVRHLLKAGGI